MGTKDRYKIIFVIHVLLFILLFYYGCRDMIKNENVFIKDSYLIFNEAIKKYISDTISDQYYTVSYHSYDPKKIGEYEVKSLILNDTVLSYKSKIVDYETMVYRLQETYLLDTYHLSALGINNVFDSICQTKNIYAETSVGIYADFINKIDTLSRDTTGMKINQRIHIKNRGEYEDIVYSAYIEINNFTYFMLFPKSIKIALIFILISFIVYSYARIKDKTKISANNFQRIKFKFENIWEINGKIIEFTEQQSTVMNMFIKEGDLLINKTELKKVLWPMHDNPTSNMTTTIKRLKNKLEEAQCGYTIITHKDDEHYYKLDTIDIKDNFNTE